MVESDGFCDGRNAVRSLKTLSDKELLNQLTKLVKQELDLTLEILPHLIEVEKRKIFRSLGYRSMFVYCTEGLGYSESSACRRIYAARAIPQEPPPGTQAAPAVCLSLSNGKEVRSWVIFPVGAAVKILPPAAGVSSGRRGWGRASARHRPGFH